MSCIHYSHCPEHDIWMAPAQLAQRGRLANGRGHWVRRWLLPHEVLALGS